MGSYKDEETLRRLYWEDGLTMAEVAEELDCSAYTISTWMDKLNVETRDHAGNENTPKHHNEQWLREKYVEESLSIGEISDLVNRDDETVRNFMEKFGIDRREKNEEHKSRPYRNKEWLKERYRSKLESPSEIAENCEANSSTIIRWLKRHGLYNSSRTGKTHPFTQFYTDKNGYEHWRAGSHENRKRVRVHRLLAVAEYGFEGLKGMEVHHKNNIQWDNRPSNIELLTKEEHTKLHHKQEGFIHG